jgi:predicted small lipoprotein YifL
MKLRVILLILTLLVLTGCGGSPSEAPDSDNKRLEEPTSEPAESEEERYPDVLDVVLTRQDDGTFDVAVTLSAPYDSASRYADGWRVLAPDGSVLGERILRHDHANEQPFTRSLSALTIPAEITEVTVEGRDQEYGYGGKTVTVQVPGREGS